MHQTSLILNLRFQGFNGDSIIGLDANNNGFFDNDDLIAQNIDSNGSVFMQRYK